MQTIEDIETIAKQRLEYLEDFVKGYLPSDIETYLRREIKALNEIINIVATNRGAL